LKAKGGLLQSARVLCVYTGARGEVCQTACSSLLLENLELINIPSLLIPLYIASYPSPVH